MLGWLTTVVRTVCVLYFAGRIGETHGRPRLEGERFAWRPYCSCVSSLSSSNRDFDVPLGESETWLARLRRTRTLLERSGIAWGADALAIDLASDQGHCAIALADMGYRVTAVEAAPELVADIVARSGHRRVTATVGDPGAFVAQGTELAKVVTCIGDGLTRIDSTEGVRALLGQVHARLVPGGTLVLGWSDLSQPLTGLDRVVPIRMDDNAIVTSFLEFAPDRVFVHQVAHLRTSVGWSITKRIQTKLRLARADIERWSTEAGFTVASSPQEPLATVVAHRAR